ncbi:MAG: hypothetical protein JW834_00690 [Candidatus Diapherotrites archaeon]|nr:hypothetical protein [Candidatus Diapherotrites archaeon]
MTKVLVGVPHIDSSISMQFIVSYLGMHKPYSINLAFERSKPLDAARNNLARMAVETGADYLFFLDSDCIFPPDTLTRLMAHGKDVISGLYFWKEPNFPPVMYKKGKVLYDHIVEYPKNSLVEVDAVGMGCCLIKTSVFRGLAEPYFKWSEAEGKRLSEDIYFCAKAKDAGHKVFVDTGVVGGHLAERAITEKHFEQAIALQKKAQGA